MATLTMNGILKTGLTSRHAPARCLLMLHRITRVDYRPAAEVRAGVCVARKAIQDARSRPGHSLIQLHLRVTNLRLGTLAMPWTIHAASEALRGGRLSPLALLDTCLERL